MKNKLFLLFGCFVLIVLFGCVEKTSFVGVDENSGLVLTQIDSNVVSLSDSLTNKDNQRRNIVVISDVHLGVDFNYSQINKNLKPLEDFLETIRVSPNVKELVIAGDFFDEWYLPFEVDAYQGKTQLDFLKRIAQNNDGVIDSINNIIKDGKILVTYVPGNHDLTITPENVSIIFPEINQARDEQLGVGTYYPVDYLKIAIEHSHRYNFFCAPDVISNQSIAPDSIMPPGYFFTRLYVTHLEQDCNSSKDKLPTLTRGEFVDSNQEALFYYWKIWEKVINLFPVKYGFDEKVIVTNVGGFTKLYSINDLIPHKMQDSNYMDITLFKNIESTWNQRQLMNKVSVNIPFDRAVANSAVASETDEQAKLQYFSNPKSDKRIVVFGHSHTPLIISLQNYFGQKSIYANSGTWIDDNVYGKTRTFVVIAPEANQTSVTVYSYENGFATKLGQDSLVE